LARAFHGTIFPKYSFPKELDVKNDKKLEGMMKPS
jgi:hypothetical protein